MWTNQRNQLTTIAKGYDKSIKLYTKDNWFCKSIAHILWFFSLIFTFGQKPFLPNIFLTQFATAIGPFHFYPSEWNEFDVTNALPHEARHTKQCRWMGMCMHPLLGLPIVLLILLLPLPIGLAFGRLWMELDAEKAKWRYWIQRYVIPEKVSSKKTVANMIRMRAENFATELASESYCFTVPEYWATSVFQKAAEGVINEAGLG